MTLNIVKDTENLGKERENTKNLVSKQKKSSEIFAVEMEIFFRKKVIQKSWSAKKFSRPLPKLSARSPPLNVT